MKVLQEVKECWNGYSQKWRDSVRSFKCPECGFFFSLDADWENMSEEEYKGVTACPCGVQMEEVDYLIDMIPTLEL